MLGRRMGGLYICTPMLHPFIIEGRYIACGHSLELARMAICSLAAPLWGEQLQWHRPYLSHPFLHSCQMRAEDIWCVAPCMSLIGRPHKLLVMEESLLASSPLSYDKRPLEPSLPHYVPLAIAYRKGGSAPICPHQSAL